MVRPAGRPVADHVYGAVPPVAVTVNGAIAVSTVNALSLTAPTAGPPITSMSDVFSGSGASSEKSLALLSVSAAEAVRVAAVELVRATPVLAPSKDAGVVPYPTMSTRPPAVTPARLPVVAKGVWFDTSSTTPLLPDIGMEPDAS